MITSDLFTDANAFDMLTLLEHLTDGFYTVTVLAESCGLSTTRTAIACKRLVSLGRAVYKPLEGYALSK